MGVDEVILVPMCAQDQTLEGFAECGSYKEE